MKTRNKIEEEIKKKEKPLETTNPDSDNIATYYHKGWLTGFIYALKWVLK